MADATFTWDGPWTIGCCGSHAFHARSLMLSRSFCVTLGTANPLCAPAFSSTERSLAHRNGVGHPGLMDGMYYLAWYLSLVVTLL